MKNEDWYTICDSAESTDGRGFHLTDKAPQEAIDSYEEFYKQEISPEGFISD